MGEQIIGKVESIESQYRVDLSKVDCPLTLLTPKPSFAISLNKEVRGHEGRKGRFFLGYGNIYAYTYMRVYMLYIQKCIKTSILVMPSSIKIRPKSKNISLIFSITRLISTNSSIVFFQF